MLLPTRLHAAAAAAAAADDDDDDDEMPLTHYITMSYVKQSTLYIHSPAAH